MIVETNLPMGASMMTVRTHLLTRSLFTDGAVPGMNLKQNELRHRLRVHYLQLHAACRNATLTIFSSSQRIDNK
ncbi:hypothetical protein KUTeg_019484 [Tegillarca granosa]|uniref:Uncharacterized protein n=1 Tax=Tegillarca granosa TaxID=220873 RepID=A0ABQ9EIM8_TEGGR|nr:hypothetical protein KUTeg_019484 [Tegillarca granosa]